LYFTMGSGSERPPTLIFDKTNSNFMNENKHCVPAVRGLAPSHRRAGSV
jgi:hypothetical protein